MVEQATDGIETGLDPFTTGKAYSIAEAARLARTTAQTVRRWLLGYESPSHRLPPAFGGRTTLAR